MVVGIDIDDTLFNTNEVIIAKALYYDKTFLKNKGFKNRDKYFFEDMLYWTKEDAHNFLKWMAEEEFIFNVPVKDGVADILDSWHNLGIKIVIITSRMTLQCEIMYEKTKEMLIKNNIYFDKLIIEAGKKGKVCRDEKIDIFIDDSYRNCLDVRSNHIEHVLMFESKYNKNCKFKKVSDWQEINEYVKVIYDERKIS